MSDLTFTIPGPPLPKERPRFSKATRKVYTTTKTKQYEKHVGAMAWAAEVQQCTYNTIFPVKERQLYVDLWIHTDKSAGRAADADNIVKAVLDGMEGVLYKNDKQVLPRVQRYSFESDNPRVEVEVTVI